MQIDIEQRNVKDCDHTMPYAMLIDQILKEKTNSFVEDMIAIRKKQGKSQQDIADITGMAASNVARIEKCKNIPTLSVLLKYADALGMEIKLDIVEKDSTKE